MRASNPSSMQRILLLLLLLAAIPLAVVPASASVPVPAPGMTELVNVSSAGVLADAGTAVRPALNFDGSLVAFESTATNLVAGDTNGKRDIFLRDRGVGTTVLLSAAHDGAPSADNSFRPSLSADGSLVAWDSAAADLVAGDANGRRDVVARALPAGVNELVSLGFDGVQANGDSWRAAVGADGRFVAFDSTASNLVPADTNGQSDVFVRDRSSGQTVRVSISTSGEQADGGSFAPSITPDGRFVVFYTLATNLAGEDVNEAYDVIVHDRATGVTERVSRASDGVPANGWASSPAISADGRFVAFHGYASNLVPDKTNLSFNTNSNLPDVYVRDRLLGRTERVSVTSSGEESAGSFGSFDPSISADGRYIAFESDGQNLMRLTTNRSPHAYVYDRVTGQLEFVSRDAAGNQGNDQSGLVAISPDGGTVGFYSWATNLVPGDTNGKIDVFVHERRGVELAASRAGDLVHLNGRARARGVVVSSTVDPSNDAEQAVPGAEITELSAIARPEEDDLLVRLRIDGIDRVRPSRMIAGRGASLAATPGVVPIVTLTTAGARYEVRAARAGGWPRGRVSIVAADLARFDLLRCAPVCEPVAALRGGFGTTDFEVRVAIPRALVEGADFQIAAATWLGDVSGVLLSRLDDVTGTPFAWPAPSATAGIAREGEEPSFAHALMWDRGRFAGTLDVASLAPGAYRAWVRVCVGAECRLRSDAVVLP